MPKLRFIDKLNLWLEKTSLKSAPSSYHSFLAVKADIIEAMENGYPAKTIWKYLYEEKIFPFSYETFCRNLRQEKKNVSDKKVKDPPSIPKKETKPDSHEPIIVGRKEPTFKYNPVPDVKKLIG